MPIEIASIQRVVEIDGSELDREADGQLESAVVIDRLVSADTFVLTFRDPRRDVLGRAGLRIGGGVKISTSSVRQNLPEELIDGEITSIECDYDALGSRAVVRGYDRSHRLQAGRRTQTFQNVKLSDIARQIASDAGLQADVDDSPGTFEHIIQPNQSDFDFVRTLARRCDFDCRVEGDTLLFKRASESSTAPGSGDFESEDPLQLVWQGNLLEFHARMSAVAQVAEVNVRGWDPSAKKEVIGKAKVSAGGVEVSQMPAQLADAVGGTSLVVVDRPVDSQEAADELARARAEQVGSAAYEATAVAIGSPALKAGTAVSISGVDAALEGKYVITTARHEFGAGSYRTYLEFSGRQDRSIHGLVSNALPDGPSGTARITGLVSAIVTANEDPQALGRVKVKYPWLSDSVESFWARIAAPGAGKDAGTVWIPEVGDEVIVGFVHGDLSQPIVLGGLWNGKDAPPLGNSLFDAGSVVRSGFVSRKGHKFVFFDSDSNSGAALITSDGKLRISVNETNGEIRVVADGKVTVEATQDISLKSNANVSIEAAQQLKLKGGSGAKLESSGIVDVDGAQITLN